MTVLMVVSGVILIFAAACAIRFLILGAVLSAWLMRDRDDSAAREANEVRERLEIQVTSLKVANEALANYRRLWEAAALELRNAKWQLETADLVDKARVERLMAVECELAERNQIKSVISEASSPQKIINVAEFFRMEKEGRRAANKIAKLEKVPKK